LSRGCAFGIIISFYVLTMARLEIINELLSISLIYIEELSGAIENKNRASRNRAESILRGFVTSLRFGSVLEVRDKLEHCTIHRFFPDGQNTLRIVRRRH
jgi:hypothetical protein